MSTLKIWFIGIVSVFLIIGGVCIYSRISPRNPANTLPVPTVSRFKPGEVWTFRPPPGALSNGTLTIIRVDFDTNEGPIIFVSVAAQRFVSPYTNSFNPFSEEALDRSVISMIATNSWLTDEQMTNFAGFYLEMQHGVAAGRYDKCFKTSVADMLETVLQAEHGN
jgi:hypothetical protein